MAVLQEVLELSLIVTILVLVSPRAMLAIVEPFTLIRVAFGRSPHSEPSFHTLMPVALECLPVVPLKGPISFSLSIQKVTSINSIDVPLGPFDFHIIFVSSLEDLLLANAQPSTILKIILILSEIDSILLFNDGEERFFD